MLPMAHTLFASSLIVGPTVGYFAQCYHIWSAQQSEGFSLLIPFILLAASLLRVHFWWGRQFDILLLWQAVAMIVCQLLLLRVCTCFPSFSQKGHSLFRNPLSHFWHWEDYGSYLSVILVVECILIITTATFAHHGAYFEVLGYFSLLTEASLAVPQVIENGRRGSVDGLSPLLVATWVLGDMAKTAYFLHTHSPAQFLVCGALQLTLDAVVVAQFALYARRHVPLPCPEDVEELRAAA